MLCWSMMGCDYCSIFEIILFKYIYKFVSLHLKFNLYKIFVKNV